MKAAVQRLHFNVGPIGTVEQVTMPVIPDHDAPLYVVAVGRRPDSIGVHDFKRSEKEVVGFPGAIWKRVRSQEEAINFITDHQEEQLLKIPSFSAVKVSQTNNTIPIRKWYAVAKG